MGVSIQVRLDDTALPGFSFTIPTARCSRAITVATWASDSRSSVTWIGMVNSFDYIRVKTICTALKQEINYSKTLQVKLGESQGIAIIYCIFSMPQNMIP